jgi:hypothetical protein
MSPRNSITTPSAMSYLPCAWTLWVPPGKWMSKIYHSRQKTLNSGSDLTEWILPHTGRAEVQKCRNRYGLHAKEAGWGQPERRVNHPLLISVLISVAENGFIPLNVFLMESFVSEGSRFLSLGVYSQWRWHSTRRLAVQYLLWYVKPPGWSW